MRFRLRTLHIAIGIGPPLIAVVWFWPSYVGILLSLIPMAGLFAFWYWMLLKSQALDPRSRGGGDDYPIYPPPA